MQQSVPRPSNRPALRADDSRRLPGETDRADRAGDRSPLRDLAVIGVLALITVVAYVPALRAGFVWDDRMVTENPVVRTWHGLGDIWFDPHRNIEPQYYPLVHTTYWIEYRLWGLRPFGYHLVNVLLHAVSAGLVWIILRRLAVPGALLAAAFFALHPVHVESVAWILARKTVLSGTLYLLALLACLRYADRRSWGRYALAWALFLAALCSKTVTCSLPVILLLLCWWKHGSIRRRDLLEMAPFLLAGAVFGLYTAHLEVTDVGAVGAEFRLSLLERVLIAGRALWFYVGKLLWPAALTAVYPRWQVDPGAAAWYVYLAGAVFLPVGLWWGRHRWGRGPFVALAYFGVTLVPAMGFFTIFFMRFSFVADHYQYLASIGPIALGSALAARAGRRRGIGGDRIAWPIGGALIVVLGALTWRQAGVYRDSESFWRDVIAKNPGAWLAYNNLGNALADVGRVDEALGQYREALKIKPGYAEAYHNLGRALHDAGDVDGAIRAYRQALQLGLVGRLPARVHNELGKALAAANKLDEAVGHYRRALEIDPGHAEAYNNLGVALRTLGRVEEAVHAYEQALRLDPQNAQAHSNLANVFARQGRFAEAIARYRQALKARPDFIDARFNLAQALTHQGKLNEAVHEFEEVLRLNPQHTIAQARLADLRAPMRSGQPN